VDACGTCYKKKRFGIQIASKGSIREDTVKSGGTVKSKGLFSPLILLRGSVFGGIWSFSFFTKSQLTLSSINASIQLLKDTAAS
jgi:hypothetical protein